MCLTLAALPFAASAQTCTFAFNPASVSVPATPDSVGTFTVTASAGNCARTAVSSNPEWLTISFGVTGTGNGSIGYRVESNTTASLRTGSISIGGTRFTVTQAAGNCNFDLSAISARVGSTAGTGTFNVLTRCSWTAQSNVSWLRVTAGASGTGDGAVQYAYDANPGADLRTGVITAGNRTFTVVQNGQGCTVRISSTTASFTAAGGTGSVDVTGNCSWTATRSQNWITFTGVTAGTGNAAVPYRVEANTTSARRFGTINVQDQALTITQDASDLPQITGITNGASFQTGAVSPGLIVVVFGARFGATPLATFELSPDDAFFTNQLAETRLLFDDVPSPMIYSVNGQISGIVPYAVAGKQRVQAVVEYQGRRSAPFGVDVLPTAPAIFTQTADGSGAAAILNEDFTLNTPFAPAGRGSVIQIYATGEGQTEPPGVDGKLTTLPLPDTIAPVQVFIGGAVAEVLYKGGAPGLVAGLVQVNALVPLAAPRGDAVPVQLRIGGRNSQGNVTVSLQ